MSLYSGKFQRSQFQGGVIGTIGKALQRVSGITAKLPLPGAGLIAKAQRFAGKVMAGPPQYNTGKTSFGVPGPFTTLPMPDIGGMGFGGPHLQKNGQPRRIRKDGRPYKAPRMNPANPRALKRSIRRVLRFGQLARAVGYGRPPKAVKNVRRIGKGR